MTWGQSGETGPPFHHEVYRNGKSMPRQAHFHKGRDRAEIVGYKGQRRHNFPIADALRLDPLIEAVVRLVLLAVKRFRLPPDEMHGRGLECDRHRNSWGEAH